MIGEMGRQLVGLFVDDGLLAAEILVVVALIAGPAALGALPPVGRRPLADRLAAGGACGKRAPQRPPGAA